MSYGSLLEGTPNLVAAREAVKDILEWFDDSEKAVDLYARIESQLDNYIGARITAATRGEDNLSLEILMNARTRIYVSTSNLTNAIHRSYRRALYCWCFNGLELNEMKTAGLIAYWIMKLHPITFFDYLSVTEKLESPFGMAFDDLNEQFAAHVILSIFVKKYPQLKLDYHAYLQKLIHALRYRNHSENSMMLLAESLGTEAFRLAAAEHAQHKN
jgi:hypothetical protein